MKLIYIANARIPTEKAHGIQIMQMLNAFANFQFSIFNFQTNHKSQIPNSKLEVELVIPRRLNKIKQNPFEYYGVERSFKIKKLPCFDLIPLAKYFGKLSFWIQSFSFACASFWYVLFKKADIIYSRDELPLFFLSFFKKNIVWEVHTARANFLAKRAAKKCKGIIAITQGLKDYYVREYNLNSSKVLVAPDGVDINKFEIRSSKSEIRNKLTLPQDKKIIGYVGKYKTIGRSKGVGELIGSFSWVLKQYSNIFLLLVGINKDELEEVERMFRELDIEKDYYRIITHIPQKDVPQYLRVSDILIMNYPKEDHYAYYMSPLKLFEYMASGRPIVASDLPSIREVLNNNNSVLVDPNNPSALADGIKKVLQNQDLADRIFRQALEDVKNYTWQKRAERILDFISKKKL